MGFPVAKDPFHGVKHMQVAHAMAFLEASQVLHRDLAARNVLVTSLQPPIVKLSDFGRTTTPAACVG
jgi:serine/threonine protein kinase